MSRLARLLVVVVAFLGATTTGGARAIADTATTAVIVIDTGTSVHAVTVDVGSGISGLAALERVASVTKLAYAGNGGAVCSIDGFGNEATQSGCLVGPNSQYWAYFHASGGAGAWTYSPVGAGSFTVHGGDVEGWRYGTGAKPAASPVFCDYVTCAPPVTTTPPSGGTGGTGTPSGGSTAATTLGGGASVTGGDAAATAGSGADAAPAPDDSLPAPSTTVSPTDESDASTT